MSSVQITDPAVITYAFFVRRTEADALEEQQGRQRRFRSHCEKLWANLMNWLDLGRGRESLPPFLNPEHVQRDEFRRLVAVTRWVQSADRRAVGFLDPTVYGDFFALEIGQAFPGGGNPQMFSKLKGERLRPDRAPMALGEACCLTGACPDGAAAGPEVLRTWGVAKTVGTVFHLGWIERPADALFPLVFLYPSTAQEEDAARLLHSLTLIGLAFEYCRLQWTLKHYREEDYPAAIEANRRTLDDLGGLRRATYPEYDAAEREESLANLLANHSELVRRKGAIERWRDAVAVGRRNLAKLLADLWGSALLTEEEFFEPCLEEYRSVQEQMEVDLRYLQRTLDEVEGSHLLVDHGRGTPLTGIVGVTGAGTGETHYDNENKVLRIGGRKVQLTRTEQAVIELLCSKPQRAFSKAEISDALPDGVADHAIEASISRLRKKIEPDPSEPRYILTDRASGGYRTTIPKK